MKPVFSVQCKKLVEGVFFGSPERTVYLFANAHENALLSSARHVVPGSRIANDF